MDPLLVYILRPFFMCVHVFKNKTQTNNKYLKLTIIIDMKCSVLWYHHQYEPDYIKLFPNISGRPITSTNTEGWRYFKLLFICFLVMHVLLCNSVHMTNKNPWMILWQAAFRTALEDPELARLSNNIANRLASGQTALTEAKDNRVQSKQTELKWPKWKWRRRRTSQNPRRSSTGQARDVS